MKNLILLLLPIALFLSCNKSDQKELSIEEQIEGEWYVHSFVINSCPNESDNVPEIFADENGCIDMDGEIGCSTIYLNSNGQGEIREREVADQILDSESITYSIDKESNIVELCYLDDDCIEFSFRDGHLLNEMDEDGCICIFDFKKLEL